MDYNLESLTDDGFQKLCQALLSVSHPDITCLPVNQPDGGRDAFSRTETGSSAVGNRDFIAFQVKFSRNPSSSSERESISSLISTEKEKVRRLKERGLTHYYFLTNVSGTAHLDRGSIDKVNEFLSSEFGIPASCFWRDDIERRIDANADIKWSFPTILRGTDLLQLLLTSDLSESGHRRRRALNAYLTSQYMIDQEVKFKQVELQNRLLDLFVDVPIAFLHSRPRFDLFNELQNGAEDAATRQLVMALAGGFVHPREKLDTVGASTVLLQPKNIELLSRLVLQGAPGQGKSTITQYVCQVHRMRILGKAADLARILPEHSSSQVKVPFRVDLRDYATWVSGKTPFGIRPNTILPAGTHPGLETFLAAQVSEGSGGFSFDVADLSAVMRESHVLIVLDGFDEVADVQIRKSLVEQIGQASRRLAEQAISLQIIVTSRPSAFANSPGFSEKDWLHLELISLTPAQIADYAGKWMSARSLPESERRRFRSVMDNRFGQPHIRDLARNPMQLAILLSLINTKGLSLPDKRTSLYSSYIELFLSREAEKSVVVRDYRELLAALHEYLAWVIQTEVEAAKSGGSIEEDRMRSLLRGFLENEGHDPDLVETLFAGMVERVVALVSRVQGTYEFEVQPLREYFCAKYLYQTAPYSPPGEERWGTKPDRFMALTGNFYWLNVTRFYAGCYSSGELSSLVDGLEQLSSIPKFKSISQSRILASTLLGDWVFSQQPLVAKRLIEFIVREPNLRVFLASCSSGRNKESLIIPEKISRRYLIESGIDLIKACPSIDYRNALAAMLRINMSSEEAYSVWKQLKDDGNTNLITLIESFEIAESIETPDWVEMCRSAESSTLQQILNALNYKIFDEDANLREKAVEGLVSGELYPESFQHVHTRDGSAGLEKILGIFSTTTFASVFRTNTSDQYREKSLKQYLTRYMRNTDATPDKPVQEQFSTVDQKIARLGEVYDEVLKESIQTWRTTLNPWNILIENGRDLFGERVVWRKLAVIAAGIKSKTELGQGATLLFEKSVPLAKRARYARLKAGVASWWKLVFSQAENEDDFMLAILIAVCWTSQTTFEALSSDIVTRLDSMKLESWQGLAWLVQDVLGTYRYYGESRPLDKNQYRGSGTSVRFLFLLSIRSQVSRQISIYNLGLRNYEGEEWYVSMQRCSAALLATLTNDGEWKDALAVVAETYAALGKINVGPYLNAKQDRNKMPIPIAEIVCSEAQKYPLLLVEMGNKVLTERAGRSALKVGKIAERQKWFLQKEKI